MNEAKAITGTSTAERKRMSSEVSINSSTTSGTKLPAEAQRSRTMTIRIEPDPDATIARSRESAKRAFRTGEYQGEELSFASLRQLFDIFTAKRWEIVQLLQELGPSSLRGLARALGRDVKRVHEDVDVLIEENMIERTEDKKIYVPFEEIRFEASLKIKAA